MSDSQNPGSASKSLQQTFSMSDFLKLKRQLEELVTRQANTSQATSSRVVIEKDPPPESGQNFKPTKLSEFHRNRIRYPAWRAAVRDTFRMDWILFGYDNSRAFLIIYNSLREEALEKAGPFEADGVNQTRDPDDFLEFLDRIYLDTTRVSQANIELHNLKMKENKRWADFFASWLTQALAGNHLLPDDDFSQWVQIVSKIAMRVEKVKRKSGWTPGPSNQGLVKDADLVRQDSSGPGPMGNTSYQQNFGETIKPTVRVEQVGDMDASGDTIMGGIDATNISSGKKSNAFAANAEVAQAKNVHCYRPVDLREVALRSAGRLDAPEYSGTQELNAEDSQVVRLNTEPFLLNALINDTQMVQVLVDKGCLCYGIIDDDLTTQLNLPRISIPPRFLETAKKSSKDRPVVKNITFISLDLDGCLTPKLWLYIVPHSSHSMILGKKRLEIQDAVIHSKEQRLKLRKGGGSVYSVKKWREGFGDVPHPESTSAQTMASIMGSVPVCKATVQDISKALRGKPSLTVEQARERLPDQIKDFAHLFADDSGAEHLPPSRGHLDHAINLKLENRKPLSPPWGPLYNISREELLVLRKTLTDLANKGWTRPSNSPAAAPVLFATKPSGGLRFCVDYRGLNAITIPDRYTLPLFKETLRQLSKAKWFTKLDVKSAFRRIRIREGDEWMTAFRCRLGLFEWLVTPFGLVNAPATLQRYINEHLREYLDLDATAYIDDILAYTNGTEEEHWKTVRSILSKLEKPGLYLNVDKYESLCQRVKYLGFIVEAGKSITVDPIKVKAILE
ncbi:hypothetical protein K3495_g4113 [Podosphaera aphanis]|nr:hypothetical protein K3495_g4113 [Podosphaera aphanis]